MIDNSEASVLTCYTKHREMAGETLQGDIAHCRNTFTAQLVEQHINSIGLSFLTFPRQTE